MPDEEPVNIGSMAYAAYIRVQTYGPAVAGHRMVSVGTVSVEAPVAR